MPIEELLLELRDIQAPLSPGWWPLAPGWWVLLAICLPGLVLWLINRLRRNQNYFKLAKQQLKDLAYQYHLGKDKQDLALGLSRWLRQVSMLAFPHRRIAGLTGLNWTRFLDEAMSNNEFTQGPGHIFAGEVYAVQTDIEAENILALCRSWLDKVKPGLLQ